MELVAANQEPPTGGAVITDASVSFSADSGGFYTQIAPVAVTYEQRTQSQKGGVACSYDTVLLSLMCGGLYGAPTYDIHAVAEVNAHVYTHGAAVVAVTFNHDVISPCFGGATDARANDSCTPPSNTRIIEAKINTNTAFFRFKARLATRFWCELIRNKRVMFNRSCQSPKPYANPLPPGKYTFLVSGVNRGGMDSKAAVKQFTIR